MNKIPDKEGWFWAKDKLGWTCIKIRKLGNTWVGLNPYIGKEYPLNYKYWDDLEWHGEAVPPNHNNIESDLTQGGPKSIPVEYKNLVRPFVFSGLWGDIQCEHPQCRMRTNTVWLTKLENDSLPEPCWTNAAIAIFSEGIGIALCDHHRPKIIE